MNTDLKRCLECGAAIPAGEYFCSDDCFELWAYDNSGKLHGASILRVELGGNLERGEKEQP